MNKALVLLAGAGLGAGAMYLLDPQMGNRRRAITRDKVYHYLRVTREGLDGASQDIRHRSYGLLATLRYQLIRTPPGDDVLVARIKSKLGHVVTHPGAIGVTADNGRVTLRGPVLAGEANRALAAVQLVPGVTEVVNNLAIHETPDSISGLQTGQQPARTR